jgi:Spy/CpxP family protein refolding chaperone
MRATCFISCFISGILLATSASLQAQPTNAPAQTPQPARRSLVPGAMNGGQAGGVAGFALGGPIGVLTDQQRASYQAIMNGQRAKLADLQAKLRDARQDLLVTSLDQKFDENVIRQKAQIVARIDAEMMVLRVKVFSQVQPPLTPEQIAKVKAGEPGPMHPLGQQQLDRSQRRATPGGTNYNDNGLPPKK